MSRKQSPLFLERRSYRLRRVMDGARLLPFLGAVLWVLPMLWASPEAEPVRTSRAMAYVFLVWLLLVALSLVLSRWLTESVDADQREGR